MAAVKVEGEKLLQRAFNTFALNLDKAIDDAVRITAVKVNQAAINSIKIPSTSGVFVKSSVSDALHEVSEDGEAPNTDSGRLIQSITFTHQRGSKVAFVGTDLDYGAILETEMNRPWLEPAKESETANFAANMKQAIIRQVEKA